MIRMLIQVAAGSTDRQVYDEGTLEYRGMRRGTLPYPYPYGFIIGTNAADGDCVDCYLITDDQLAAGAIVECEPVGLLLQDEGGEIDHKILAVLPGQDDVLKPEVVQTLQEFIRGIFAPYPHIRSQVGPVLSKDAALQYLQEHGLS